jgi:hypothetical protein
MTTHRLTSLLGLALCAWTASAAELRIPAFTAYTLPDAEGARVSQREGVTRWTDPALSVNWYGQFKHAGEVTAKVVLRLPKDAQSKLKLTVGEASREVTVLGTGSDTPVTADFGAFKIAGTGFQRFALTSLNERGQPSGNLEALVLDGPAAEDAHFNLKERRNAASVHMNYPLPPEEKIQWFYNEVTGVTDPTSTFYMACGFNRGYFGMQVNSPTERRIIFSVWDSGNEGVDRSKVAADDRVQLIAKGEGVYAGDFGNEGTGGHSHLKTMWKTGQTQRFLLGAQPVDATHTVYAGYWWNPEQQDWLLIAAMKAPKAGGYLTRLHAFSENFWGSNGHIQRKALYGNQWVRTAAGQWLELTVATFSHDATGRGDRLDRYMGFEDGKFFLSHGGFVEGTTPFGEKFTRPTNGKAPDFKLPEIPLIAPK